MYGANLYPVDLSDVRGWWRWMIRCNSPYAYGDRCVADMDSQQSHGGSICCDTAEDLGFDGVCILERCEYAERMVDGNEAD